MSRHLSDLVSMHWNAQVARRSADEKAAELIERLQEQELRRSEADITLRDAKRLLSEYFRATGGDAA